MASSTCLHSKSLLLLIFLFHPSIFSVTVSASNCVSLNSFLSTDADTSWDSPSGEFSFGFRHVRFNNTEFMPLLAIWFTKVPNQTLVWYAKAEPKIPAFPVGSTAKLTSNGIAVYDPQGHERWRRPQSNGTVTCPSMLDNGNFVLQDKDGNPVWQSFEEPADTILPGQNLTKPMTLEARQSDTSFYDGNFELSWQEDSNLVLYYSPDSVRIGTTKFEPYWASSTFYPQSQVIFDEFGHIYIGNDTTVMYNVTKGIPGSKEYYYMARIDSDGVFRLYNYRKAQTRGADSCPSGWHVAEEVPQDICLAFTVETGNVLCGFNSYCFSESGEIQCLCPDHYIPFQQDNLIGCRPDFPLPSCQNDGWEENKAVVDFEEYPNVDWPLSDYDHLIAAEMDKDMCKKTCREDCFCVAAIYD